MSILFKDGEEGFPGDLPVRVVYTVTDNNELVITYDAVAVNKKTVANFTVHTFFNLSGDLGSSITDTIFTVNGTRVLEVTPALAPNGKIREVAGTPMDFREPKTLGKDIGADYDLLKAGGGYDNHFIIDQKAPGAFTFDVRAYDPRSGRILEVWSTEPGIQLYSGNFLEGKVPRDVGKGNTVYKFRSGFCLEPSHFPDSLNHADFPSTTLNPGDWYSGKIVYRFSTDRGGMPVGKASSAKSDVKK
jgi:aldose 1-epimerase